MRNIALYSFLTLAVVALASCGKTDNPAIGNFPSDGIVRINTTVAAPVTKADGGPTLYSGNTLGLFLDYGDGQKYTQNNYLWENDGSNNWSAATPMLWKDASTSLDGIYAYAPYIVGEDNPNEVRFTIPRDQSQGLDDADLLWCPMQNFDPAQLNGKGQIDIAFKHALVKLTVNITLGTEFKGKDISVREAWFRKSVDKAAIYFRGISGIPESVVGLASSVSANAVSIKMHDCSADGKLACEVIFYPYDVTAGQEMLTITLSDGKDYRLTPGNDIAFVLGSAYQMNVKVGNDKIEIGEVKIADWGGSKKVVGDDADFEAAKSPVPVNISDLCTQLSEWNKANPSAQKSLADMITRELLDESLGGNGELIVTGEFDNSEPLSSESEGMSKETLEAFAVIAAYVRNHDVTSLDISGLKGVKSLTEVRAGAEEVYNLRFSSVIYENSTISGAGSKLETFIGSEDVVNITSAFDGCAGLVSVSGLKNVTNADYAFVGCSSLSKTPDLPNVVSLKNAFPKTLITELKYESVKEITVGSCGELIIIDCPNVVRLGENAFWSLPKLTEIRLESKYFESVHSLAFNGIVKGQNITLWLDESQKDNIDTANKTWTPKKNGESVVVGGEYVYLDYFKAVYCGTDKVL